MKRSVYLKNTRVAIDGILEVGLLFVEHYYSCYYYFYDYSYPKSYFAIVAIIFLYVFVWFYDIFLFIRRFSCVFCLLYEFSRGETCYLNWKFLKTFMKKKIKVAPRSGCLFYGFKIFSISKTICLGRLHWITIVSNLFRSWDLFYFGCMLRICLTLSIQNVGCLLTTQFYLVLELTRQFSKRIWWLFKSTQKIG